MARDAIERDVTGEPSGASTRQRSERVVVRGGEGSFLSFPQIKGPIRSFAADPKIDTLRMSILGSFAILSALSALSSRSRGEVQ